MKAKKGKFINIPDYILYDNRLTLGARIMYGEIDAFCHKEGHCWATNRRFAELYGKTKTTISKWIAELQSYGYISIVIEYKEGTKEIEYRYLSIIDHPTQENLHRVSKKTIRPSPRKLKDPPQENLKVIEVKNTSNNTINNTLNNTANPPPSNNSNSPSKKEPVKDPKKEDPLPVAIFSDRLIEYLNEPGTPDFFWECFEELTDWSKKKDVYIDWETEEGFKKNRKAAANLFSRIRIATGKDETGDGIELEIKKFLNKPDDWWYDNGISLGKLDRNFEQIFNLKKNGKSKRDNKPEPGDYAAEAEKVKRGEFYF